MSFTPDQIAKACAGKSRSAGGLNMDDLIQLVDSSIDASRMSRTELLAAICKSSQTAPSSVPAPTKPAPAPSKPTQAPPAPASTPKTSSNLTEALAGKTAYRMSVDERKTMLRDCGDSTNLDTHPCCAQIKEGDQCSYTMCTPSTCTPHCDQIYGSSVLARMHKAPQEVKDRVKRQFDAYNCSRARGKK